MRAFALLALVAGAGAWDLGKTASGAKIGGYKALADRPQETQTMELVCNGANPATGCNVDQTNPATRTWTGNWDYIKVAGGYPQGPARTKANEGLITWTGSNGVPILVFVYWGIYFAVMFLYHIYRSATSIKRDVNIKSTDVLGEDKSLAITGYKDTSLGNLCFYVYHTYTWAFVLIYFTLIIDTYWDCELQGPDNLCFRGANPILGNGKFPAPPAKLAPSVNQNVFFVCWCAGMAWALWNFFYGANMANYFRDQCSFGEATHILCQRENKRVVMSKPSTWVKVSRWVGNKLSGNVTYYADTSPVESIGAGKKSFTFMCTQYAFDKRKSSYKKATFALETSYPALRQLDGLSNRDQEERIELLGKNEIPYRLNTWIELVGNEFSSYLYIYQFTFFMVWLWFGGLIWCSSQMVVVVVCASMSIKITRANQLKIQEIGEAGKGAKCEVKRNGNWQTNVSADILVPGDMLKLGNMNNVVLPCDLIVTRGTCITDESGLTGESMPVRKSEVPSTAGNYNKAKDQKHTLYAGTTLLQAGEDAVAVVSETGIRTEKGDLVSAILYPADMIFEYDEELKVVFIFLSIYAAVLFAISIWLQMKISPMSWISIFAFACFTISQILPPLLPVALVIGHTNSSNRLKEKSILCVQPKRIAISGKIHTFCFDKTGTLTKQGLDFIGVHRVEIDSNEWSPAVNGTGSKSSSNIAKKPKNMDAIMDSWGGDDNTDTQLQKMDATEPAEMVNIGDCMRDLTEGEGYERHFTAKGQKGDMLSWSMATCHAVTTYRKNGQDELVGNQVEVNMFEGSGWKLDESRSKVVVTNGGEKLTIEKRFEFDHHTMTMSVVVRDQNNCCHVFCKGAPERVADLCVDHPDYNAEVARFHAMQGCYVIGMSYRNLGSVSEREIGAMTRNEAEAKGSLKMIGLLLFRNELKVETSEAIHLIREGDVRPVMVTGDNAFCGYYIAKKCGIVATVKNVGTNRIFISEVSNKSGVTFVEMGSSNTTQYSVAEALKLCQDSRLTENEKQCELAVTGKALTILTAQDNINALLLEIRIFARVSPDQKVQVVTLFIDEGFITGMCGDGGNDCGALRAAHAGIALSDAEASVVSPFTSKKKEIMSVVSVLCEGRCALVTSFAAYRFYITYGLNWSIVKTINFVYGVRMPISAYLTIDSICSWLCAWAITGALPLDKLQNFRPTSSLFAPQIMLSVLCPWVCWMTLMAIMLAYEGAHPNHVDMQPQLSNGVGYWELGDTWESTIFTYFQVCPLIWCGVTYSLGSHFRQSLFKNYAMLTVWGIIFLIYSICILVEPGSFSAFFHVASNGHNGFNTESPVWMRYQFPRGCPDSTSSLAYNKSVGLGSWRGSLPPASTCFKINAKVGTCNQNCKGAAASCGPSTSYDGQWNQYISGVLAGSSYATPSAQTCTDAIVNVTKSTELKGACVSVPGCEFTPEVLGHIPGMPTPGMDGTMRFIIWFTVLCGMFFAMTWEMYLDWKYVNPAKWESHGDEHISVDERTTTVKNVQP